MVKIIEVLNELEHLITQKKDIFININALTEEETKILRIDTMGKESLSKEDMGQLLDQIDTILDKKQDLLDNLNELDTRLDLIVGENDKLFQSDLESHAVQISRIRQLMDEVSTLGRMIRDMEIQNKAIIARKAKGNQQEINVYRKSRTVASRYSQNMINTHRDDQSYFINRKK